MAMLAIANTPDCQSTLKARSLDEETLRDDFEHLVADVISSCITESCTAGKDVMSLRVFTEPNQKVDFCLMVMISRGSAIFHTWPLVEELLHKAMMKYFDSRAVDVTFVARIVVIDQGH